MSQQVLSSGTSHSFTSCEWHDRHADALSPGGWVPACSGGGIFLNIVVNAIVTVNKCLFDSCNATSRGGGICVKGLNSLILTETRFSNCTCGENGGAFDVRDVSACLKIGKCQIEQCSGQYGGACYIHVEKTVQSTCTTNALMNDENAADGDGSGSCFYDNTYKQCYAIKGYGGAMQLFTNATEYNLRNCQFVSCWTVEHGGAFTYQFNTSTIPENRVPFYFLLFITNKCTNPNPFGHDVSIFDNMATAKIRYNPSPFVNCLSTHGNDNSIHYSRSAGGTGYKQWMSSMTMSRQIATNGSDESEFCGLGSWIECKTVSYAVSQAFTGVKSTMDMSQNDFTETKEISCGVNEVSLSGKMTDTGGTTIKTQMSSAGKSLFSASTGSFTLSDFEIIHDSSHSNNLDCGLFKLTGSGSIKISGVDISAGEGHAEANAFSVALVNINSGTIEMSSVKWSQIFTEKTIFQIPNSNTTTASLISCSFTNVKPTNGISSIFNFKSNNLKLTVSDCNMTGCGSASTTEGGAMTIGIGTTNDVAISGGNVSSCVASESNGLGGGFYLQFTDASRGLTINDVQFTDNKAKHGHDIFVYSPSLKSTVEANIFKFLNDSDEFLELVEGFNNGNASFAIPLCLYLKSAETIGISTAYGENFDACGFTGYPCETLDYAFTRQSITHSITFFDASSLKGQTFLNSGTYSAFFEGETKAKLTLNYETPVSGAFAVCSVKTEFRNIVFELPQNIGSFTSIFSVTASTLTITNCELAPNPDGTALTCGFAVVTSGAVTVDGFAASNCVFTLVPAFSASGSTSILDINSLALNNVQSTSTSGLLSTENGAQMKLSVLSYQSNALPLTKFTVNGKVETLASVFITTAPSTITFGKDGTTSFDISCASGSELTEGLFCVEHAVDFRKINFLIPSSLTPCTSLIEQKSETLKVKSCSVAMQAGQTDVIAFSLLSIQGGNAEVESLSIEGLQFTPSLVKVGSVDATVELLSFQLNDVSSTEKLIEIVSGGGVTLTGFSYSIMDTARNAEKTLSIGGKVKVEESIFVKDGSLTFGESLETEAFQKISTIEGIEAARGLFVSGHSSTFNSIEFVVLSSLNQATALIEQTTETLQLKSCKLSRDSGQTDSIVYNIIKGEGQSVLQILDTNLLNGISFNAYVIELQEDASCEINTIKIQDVSFDDYGAFVHGGNKKLVSVCNLELVSASSSKNSLFLIENGSSLSIDSSNTSSLNSTALNGGLINSFVGKDSKIIIVNSNITACLVGVGGGCGGCIFCTLDQNGCFNITDCSMTENMVSEENGKGGAIYLQCNQQSSDAFDFTFTDIDGNKAHLGMLLYLKAPMLKTTALQSKFHMDFRDLNDNSNLMFGDGSYDYPGGTSLLELWEYKSHVIYVGNSYVGQDFALCGSSSSPCRSLNYGVERLTGELQQLFVVDECKMTAEVDLTDRRLSGKGQIGTVTVSSSSANNANDGSAPIHLLCGGDVTVELLNFKLPSVINSEHFVYATSGDIHFSTISFESFEAPQQSAFPFSLFNISCSTISISNINILNAMFGKAVFVMSTVKAISVSNVKLNGLTIEQGDIFSCTSLEILLNNITLEKATIQTGSAIAIAGTNTTLKECTISDITLAEKCLISVNLATSTSLTFDRLVCNKINCAVSVPSIAALSPSSAESSAIHGSPISMFNSSFSRCVSSSEKGSILTMDSCTNVAFDGVQISFDTPETEEESLFLGNSEFAEINEDAEEEEEADVCTWNNSAISLVSSTVVMKDTSFTNCSKGALSISGGRVTVEMGMFSDNSPQNKIYPSLRRNMLCADQAVLYVDSLKGGDGVFPSVSYWISDDKCKYNGVLENVTNKLFVPTFTDLKSKTVGDMIELTFYGERLLPCNLSFRLISVLDQVSDLKNFDFTAFPSDTVAQGSIPASAISAAQAEVEVSIVVVYGLENEKLQTLPYVLKNKTDPVKPEPQEPNDDNKITKSSNTGTITLVLMIIFLLLFIVVVVVLIAYVIRQQRRKREMESVNHSYHKEIEMTSMIGVPMNTVDVYQYDERVRCKDGRVKVKRRKARLDSSKDRLLPPQADTSDILSAMNDSTDDSQWEWIYDDSDESMDVDSTSKDRYNHFSRRPISPSSSTTSDSISTSTICDIQEMVPTTSSISNLVEGMSCETPYETIIVDMRDSLYCGIHNEKNKHQHLFATAAQKELSAARILFWVIVGCDHILSMNMMTEVVALLSPHVILFGDEGVIVLGVEKHGGSSKKGDSSESIASESDTSDTTKKDNSDDEEGIQFVEAGRWSAPELTKSATHGPTEKSAAFSIGMILWEIMTTEVPFQDYDAISAGMKIASGVFPDLDLTRGTPYGNLIQTCVVMNPADRPSFTELKRELITHFPEGFATLTQSDAIDLNSVDAGDSDSSEGSSSLGSRDYPAEDQVDNSESDDDMAMSDSDEEGNNNISDNTAVAPNDLKANDGLLTSARSNADMESAGLLHDSGNDDDNSSLKPTDAEDGVFKPQTSFFSESAITTPTDI